MTADLLSQVNQLAQGMREHTPQEEEDHHWLDELKVSQPVQEAARDDGPDIVMRDSPNESRINFDASGTLLNLEDPFSAKLEKETPVAPASSTPASFQPCSNLIVHS